MSVVLKVLVAFVIPMWVVEASGEQPCGAFHREEDAVSPGSRDFMQTSSRRFVRRLKSGALLLVKNGPLDKDVGRNDMAAYISDDDGSTWKGGLLLHKGACSYPDGDQAADGSIYVIYDTERTGNRVNSLARFTEDDVRAGKVVSETSDLGLKVDVRK